MGTCACVVAYLGVCYGGGVEYECGSGGAHVDCLWDQSAEGIQSIWSECVIYCSACVGGLEARLCVGSGFSVVFFSRIELDVVLYDISKSIECQKNCAEVFMGIVLCVFGRAIGYVVFDVECVWYGTVVFFVLQYVDYTLGRIDSVCFFRVFGVVWAIKCGFRERVCFAFVWSC